MMEKYFRNKLKRIVERHGGFVFRINDVPGTGMRYADLIWVVNGQTIGLECKIARFRPSYTPELRQGVYASSYQVLANHLFQKAGALFLYVYYFPNEKETRCLFYQSNKVYSYDEESQLQPTAIVTLDDLFAVALARENGTILERFQHYLEVKNDENRTTQNPA